MGGGLAFACNKRFGENETEVVWWGVSLFRMVKMVGKWHDVGDGGIVPTVSKY
jgi:hypothetical protein